MLIKLNEKNVSLVIKDDPVRPHIRARWRTQTGREVYGLYNDQSCEKLRAVICVSYTDDIPTCEDDLEKTGTEIAVFYTVWSYDKGAGREIVFSAAKQIKNRNKNIKRFVTLSPLTEMARRFHLSNGAIFLNKHLDCQNFEYKIDNIK